MNYSLTNCKPGKNKSDSHQIHLCLKEIPSTTGWTGRRTGFGIDFWHTVEFSRSGRTPSASAVRWRFPGQLLHCTRLGRRVNHPLVPAPIVSLFRRSAWSGVALSGNRNKGSRGDPGAPKGGSGSGRKPPLIRQFGPEGGPIQGPDRLPRALAQARRSATAIERLPRRSSIQRPCRAATASSTASASETRWLLT
jgi:hypothetical protein